MMQDSELKKPTTARWEQERAAERKLELSLAEAITALLCWCERVEEHPNSATSVRRKPTIAPTVRNVSGLALRRRAELMTHRSSNARMTEELKRLKSMVSFLKNELWPTLGQPLSESSQNLPASQLN